MSHAHRINLASPSLTINFDHASHDEIFIPVSANADTVVTLPTHSTGFGAAITVKKLSPAGSKVTIHSAATIDGAVNYELNTQWAFVTLVADGADSWSVVSRG
jgi:hypothetical protein